MKQFLKRYMFFFIMLFITVAIGLIWPDIGQNTAALTVENCGQMLAVIPPIFVLLGLLDVWVDRATMIKYTGKGSGIKGTLIAFLLGSAAAGPLYAAFPVAAMMMKKGSRLFNVFIFVGAWSTTKIPMLTFEAASMGLTFMLVRLSLSIIGIIVIAYITEKSLNTKQEKELYQLHRD